MKNEILVKLRNVLAHLYPDEASMRRISHDAALDLARVSLNSSAANNWHSILIEAEKLDWVNALLAVIKNEYGSNQVLLDAYNAYHSSIVVISWTNLATELINDLNNALQQEQKKQQELKKQRKPGSHVDPIIQSNIDRLSRKVTELVNINWPKAEQAYLDKVINLYNHVRILGHSVDVPLGNIFTQLYILDKPTARHRHDIEELRKQDWDRFDFQRQLGQKTPGLDLVKTQSNLFILGKPGAGKTTFLKYITIQAARKQLPRIPIFISLNQWADSIWGKGTNATILPFIVEQFEICDFPDAVLFIDYLLKEGRALVLFDGLDEVKQEKEQRHRLTHLLQDFARKYNKSQYLITCRIAASDYAFSGFADVEVANFTLDQAHEYARHWFGGQDKKFEAFTRELAKPDNCGLAELCTTPLLLSLLCLTFDNTMRFPPSRAELYEDALETLLRKWDASREISRDEIYRALSHKRKLQLLMSIAVPTFEKGEIFFRQRDLERRIVNYLAKLPGAPPTDVLDGTAILKAIEAQHSILVERAQGIYSFSHLTFQEYLTARHLAENQGKGMTGELIRKHLTDTRWREFFLLTASLLDDADGFITTMRYASDSIIVDTPSVIHLLMWASDRTQRVNVPVERRTVVQLVHIFLSLVCMNKHPLAHDLSNALLRACALALTLDLTLTVDPAHALKREREPQYALARETTPLVGFDYGLYYSWACASLFASRAVEINDKNWRDAMKQFSNLVMSIAELAINVGLANLAQQLTDHIIPLPKSSKRVWQQYADILFAMLRDQRDLAREWSLSEKEINKLNDYFYAHELLMQCLKVAAVSNREAVLQGLLLPPEGLKGEGV